MDVFSIKSPIKADIPSKQRNHPTITSQEISSPYNSVQTNDYYQIGIDNWNHIIVLKKILAEYNQRIDMP